MVGFDSRLDTLKRLFAFSTLNCLLAIYCPELRSVKLQFFDGDEEPPLHSIPCLLLICAHSGGSHLLGPSGFH